MSADAGKRFSAKMRSREGTQTQQNAKPKIRQQKCAYSTELYQMSAYGLANTEPTYRNVAIRLSKGNERTNERTVKRKDGQIHFVHLFFFSFSLANEM